MQQILMDGVTKELLDELHMKEKWIKKMPFTIIIITKSDLVSRKVIKRG